MYIKYEVVSDRAYPKNTNSMAMFRLEFRKPLVGTGWNVSLLLHTVQLRK